MSDFESALQARLAHNAELDRRRAQAEVEMERVVAERKAAMEREQREVQVAREARHADLVDALTAAAQQLKAASPETFIVRLGWTESRQEFMAKLSTRLLEPSRSLFIELDRDDDEVLVRWNSDVGSSLELWRLLECPPDVLEELVLQVADQSAWRGRSAPPPFPEPDAAG